jgi:hypothetical protein
MKSLQESKRLVRIQAVRKLQGDRATFQRRLRIILKLAGVANKRTAAANPAQTSTPIKKKTSSNPRSSLSSGSGGMAQAPALSRQRRRRERAMRYIANTTRGGDPEGGFS